MKKYVILGAGEILGDIIDLIGANGDSVRKIVLDRPRDRTLTDFSIETVSLEDFRPEPGDRYGRGSIDETAFGDRFPLDTLVHPGAIVSPTASFGAGSIVSAGAIVASGVVVGRDCFLGAGAIVGHDTVLEDGVVIRSGASVAGHVRIGRGASIGLGASIIEDRTIGAGAVVEAGGVVIGDVPAGAIVAGIPARTISDRDAE